MLSILRHSKEILCSRSISTLSLVQKEKKFFESKQFAVVGVSQNPNKWGTKVPDSELCDNDTC